MDVATKQIFPKKKASNIVKQLTQWHPYAHFGRYHPFPFKIHINIQDRSPYILHVYCTDQSPKFTQKKNIYPQDTSCSTCGGIVSYCGSDVCIPYWLYHRSIHLLIVCLHYNTCTKKKKKKTTHTHTHRAHTEREREREREREPKNKNKTSKKPTQANKR